MKTNLLIETCIESLQAFIISVAQFLKLSHHKNIFSVYSWFLDCLANFSFISGKSENSIIKLVPNILNWWSTSSRFSLILPLPLTITGKPIYATKKVQWKWFIYSFRLRFSAILLECAPSVVHRNLDRAWVANQIARLPTLCLTVGH